MGEEFAILSINFGEELVILSVSFEEEFSNLSASFGEEVPILSGSLGEEFPILPVNLWEGPGILSVSLGCDFRRTFSSQLLQILDFLKSRNHYTVTRKRNVKLGTGCTIRN